MTSREEPVDVLIIGAGPAGLTAALTVVRQTRTAILFDFENYRNGAAHHMHFRDEAQKEILGHYSTAKIEKAELVKAEKINDSLFQVMVSKGNVWHGKKLILATGSENIYPDITCYEDIWSNRIFHCLFCHGYEDHGTSSTGVLAVQSAAAAHLATHFAEIAAQLSSSTAVKLDFVDGTSATETFIVHNLFTKIQGPFAEQLGLDTTPGPIPGVGGDIAANPPMYQTSVRGVFAARDCITPHKVVAGAISSARNAAVGASTQLMAEKYGHEPNVLDLALDIPRPFLAKINTLAHKPPFFGRWQKTASIFPRRSPIPRSAFPPFFTSQPRSWRYHRSGGPLSRILRALSFPRTRGRIRANLWTFRHETLTYFRHRAQARLYRAIVKRQERLRRRRSRVIGRRRVGGGNIWSLLRALNLKRRAGLLPPPGRGLTSRTVSRSLKNVDSSSAGRIMSRFGGYGSERWGSDDSGRETGSRRQKMMGYLKAANEIRQTYQSQLSQKWQEYDRGVDAPGAFPDYDITSSGKEEMLLFPSYARRHVKKTKTNGRPAQSQSLPGTDGQSSATGDEDYWREEWDKYEDSNAIVDVDVRGWIYTPQHGPMNRKQRLMVALARKLSDFPAPTAPVNHPVQRHAAMREEEDVNREAQNLIDKGEQDADVVWRTNHAEAESDSDLPKRVTRSGTNTLSSDKSDMTVLNTNLMNRLKPFMHNPSADTPVTLFFYNDQQSQSRTTITNESGHFNVRAALEFVPTHVRVLANETLSVTDEVKIIEPAGVSLISDIDDTIKHSAIASGAKEVFWNTFIRDFNDLTIQGVREWYGRLYAMGVGIHYVSNAPWQLYPQLKMYFKMAGLPNGSFHLKQYSGMLQGIFEPTAERKRGSLEKIMGDFPERKFILVGDSGEADLEVYTELVQQNPGRILGVFIRDVTTTEKKEFFDHSFAAQRRSGYSTPSSEPVEKRPPLPPRKPSSAQTINNSDLMTFDDESSGDDVIESPDKPAAKEPPVKPSKPMGLRTAATMPIQSTEKPADVIRRKPAPPLPNKPLILSSTSTDSEKKSPLPQRRATNDTYTEAVKNIAMDVYNNLPSTKDTLDSLSNLSLKHDNSSTQSDTSKPASRRGAPPPVPPTRRGAAATYTSNSDDRKAVNNIPPPAPPPRLPSRQNTFSSITSTSTTRPTTANTINPSTYYDYPEPSAPVLNKREELWKRRWERAQQILSDHGVLLGSWRVGSDVQDVTVWLVENAMKKAQEKDSEKEKSGKW